MWVKGITPRPSPSGGGLVFERRQKSQNKEMKEDKA